MTSEIPEHIENLYVIRHMGFERHSHPTATPVRGYRLIQMIGWRKSRFTWITNRQMKHYWRHHVKSRPVLKRELRKLEWTRLWTSLAAKSQCPDKINGHYIYSSHYSDNKVSITCINRYSFSMPTEDFDIINNKEFLTLLFQQYNYKSTIARVPTVKRKNGIVTITLKKIWKR